MNGRAQLLVALLSLAACASEPLTMSLDSADSTYAVEVLGEGFVRWESRRVPRETMVLELRQRVRELDAEARKSTRVEIVLAAEPGDSVLADNGWIIDQCGIMGIGQCKVR